MHSLEHEELERFMDRVRCQLTVIKADMFCCVISFWMLLMISSFELPEPAVSMKLIAMVFCVVDRRDSA